MQATPAAVPPLRPVGVSTVAGAALAALREAITAGTYPPGSHLVEREVAASLGVSTIAVREAYTRLLEEGLVVRVPRRGTFVASSSEAELRDLSDIRTALEHLVVARAIRRWTPATRAEIQVIIERMRKAARARDRAALNALDREFHEAFWRAAGSATLLALAANLRGRIAHFIRAAADSLPASALERTPELHQRWLDAVASGELARARSEVAQQIAEACERIVAALPRPDDDRQPRGAG